MKTWLICAAIVAACIFLPEIFNGGDDPTTADYWLSPYGAMSLGCACMSLVCIWWWKRDGWIV